MRNCTKDDPPGAGLGAGLQEQASNHLKLLWPKVMVVSVEEKVWLKKNVPGSEVFVLDAHMMIREQHAEFNPKYFLTWLFVRRG